MGTGRLNFPPKCGKKAIEDEAAQLEPPDVAAPWRAPIVADARGRIRGVALAPMAPNAQRAEELPRCI